MISKTTSRATILFVLITFLVSPNLIYAKEKKSLWEVGLISGAFTWPHYIGSDQRYTLPVVLPAILYRGDFFRVDRKGLRGLFYQSENIALDIGFSGGVPVSNDNNDARKGMPDLPITVQMGPRLVVKLFDGNNSMSILGRFPVRSVWDIEGRNQGWAAEPDLMFSNRALFSSSVSMVIRTGLLYGSQKYHDLLYTVDERFITPTRPAFKAQEGYNSFSISARLRRSITRNISSGIVVQWRGLHNSVINDSPLVRIKDNYGGVVWLRWTFWRSKAREGKKPIISEPSEGL